MRTTITSFLVLAVLACGGMEGCVSDADAATKFGPNNINQSVQYNWSGQQNFSASSGAALQATASAGAYGLSSISVNGTGVRAATSGSGDTVYAINSGSGSAVAADASAGTFYALYSLGNTTKAHSHMQPLAGDPSSLADGDCWITTSAFKCRVNGATYTLAPSAIGEFNFSAFKTGTGPGAGFGPVAKSFVTNASTLTDNTTLVTLTAGVGGGNLVLKLCTDGTTCAAPNTLVTCTVACATALATAVACVRSNSAVSAATTLTWSESTICGTDPAVNLNSHFTIP